MVVITWIYVNCKKNIKVRNGKIEFSKDRIYLHVWSFVIKISRNLFFLVEISEKGTIPEELHFFRFFKFGRIFKISGNLFLEL